MLGRPPLSPPALTPRPAPASLGSKSAPRLRVARSRVQQWRRRRRGRGISDWVLRLPPPRAASFLPLPGAARGSARGAAPMRLRLDAAPPARGSAAQRSTRLQWRRGVPRGPRALPDPGKENLRFQMPNRGIPRRAAQPWGGGRALGGQEGGRKGKGRGDAAKEGREGCCPPLSRFEDPEE